MRRIFIGGIGLLLCAAVFARGLRATADKFVGARFSASQAPEIGVTSTEKTEMLMFIFRGLDPAENVAILRPMIAPDIGVQLDKGATKLERGAVLQCQPSTREHDALVDGQISKISELVLTCGDHQFVVKGMDFSQRMR